MRADLGPHAAEVADVPDDQLVDRLYASVADRGIAKPDFNRRIAEKYTPKTGFGQALGQVGRNVAANAFQYAGRGLEGVGNTAWAGAGWGIDPSIPRPPSGTEERVASEITGAIRGPGYEEMRQQVPGGPVGRFAFSNPLDVAGLVAAPAELATQIPKIAAARAARRAAEAAQVETARITGLMPATPPGLLQAGVEQMRPAPAMTAGPQAAGMLEYKPRPGRTFVAGEAGTVVESPAIARGAEGRLKIVPSKPEMSLDFWPSRDSQWPIEKDMAWNRLSPEEQFKVGTLIDARDAPKDFNVPRHPPTPDAVEPASVQAPPPPPGTEGFRRLIAGERTDPRGMQRGHVPSEGPMTIPGPPPPPGTPAFNEIIRRTTPRSGAPQTSEVMREGSGPFSTSMLGTAQLSAGARRMRAAMSGVPTQHTAQGEAGMVQAGKALDFRALPDGYQGPPVPARIQGRLAASAMTPGPSGPQAPMLSVPGAGKKKLPGIARGLRYDMNTLERNLRDILPKAHADAAIRDVVEPLRESGTNGAGFMNSLFHRLEDYGTKLGIAKGSKEDAIAASLGEGKATLDQVKAAFPDRWQDIQNWSDTARKVYKDLLTKINRVREQHGLEPVPERPDYITHTRQMGNMFERFGDLIHESGASPFMADRFAQPQRPGFRYGLHRRGMSKTVGIYESLESYVPAASHQIFMTGPIQRLRGFQGEIESAVAAGNTDWKHFAKYIDRYTNDVAGTPSAVDAWIMDQVQPISLRLSDALTRRTSVNMIAGNPSSALTNLIPFFTQAIHTTDPKAMARGLMEVQRTLLADPAFIGGVRSGFLTRRYAKTNLGRTKMQQAEHAMRSVFLATDEPVARTIVAGKYYEGIGKGLAPEAAMKQADAYAASVITDRSTGQVPLIFKHRWARPATQFQIEVLNQAMHTLKDVPRDMGYSKAKVAQVLTRMAVGSYVFNELYYRVVGRRPAFDPIHVVQRTVQQARRGDDMGDILDPTDPRSAMGEAVQNAPFGNLLGGPGGRFPVEAGLPDVIGLMKGDARWSKELKKPATYIAPPFAGAQAKKMIEGVQALKAGEVRSTPGKRYSTGRYMYDVPEDELARVLLFGKGSTPEAREFYENKR